MFVSYGTVASLSFKGGKAFFRSKYVETKVFVTERHAGKLFCHHPLSIPMSSATST